MDRWAYTRGLKILGLTHSLSSNVGTLIHNPIYFEPGEIYSQVTNWERIEDVDDTPEMNSHLRIFDSPDQPFELRSDGEELIVQGDISSLEGRVHDRRRTLLGNIGLWYRHALVTQERHGIFSLHAAAIYKPDKNELFIVVGKAGSGKTVFLLEAISRGYQVFSTEMTYFSFLSEGIKFHRGALFDNIRAGTLIHDFPGAIDQLGIEVPQVDEPWEYKLSVDMRPVKTAQSEITNPILSFVFPRIEKGIAQAFVKDISDPRKVAKLLFASASEKIGSTFLMYESIPTVGLDTAELAAKRWEAMLELVEGGVWEIRQAVATLAGQNNCMESIEQ
ncbi:MAG: hypothetical protein V3V44_02800 [Anaerolineales bacterium]